VTTALTLMVNRRLRSIPVVQRQTRKPMLVGIVSRKDVLLSLPLVDSPGWAWNGRWGGSARFCGFGSPAC